MSNKIPNNRKIIYYIGLGLTVIGFILFLIPFFSIFNFDPFYGNDPFGNMKYSLIGFFMVLVGQILRFMGSKGMAGSGIILDPDRAREDLRPHSSARGKILKDVLDETGFTKRENDREIIKVRCQNCRSLNDEDSKYCKNCGREI